MDRIRQNELLKEKNKQLTDTIKALNDSIQKMKSEAKEDNEELVIELANCQDLIDELASIKNEWQESINQMDLLKEKYEYTLDDLYELRNTLSKKSVHFPLMYRIKRRFRDKRLERKFKKYSLSK